MTHVDVDNASSSQVCPSASLIESWAKAALLHEGKEANVAIMILDEGPMQELNQNYRKKPKPTNVLSFPTQLPESLRNNFIGDIAICAQVVEKEAKAQNKPLEAHFAHLVIHGVLHLLGFDHETSLDAHKMESTEIRILNDLGFPDPYLTEIIHD